MYTFTLHYEYYSNSLKQAEPAQSKTFEAIDERQATAMAHLEIQTMAPLSKIVGHQICVYQPRMTKLEIPADYPPVVTALAKSPDEIDPVVEALKKEAREIFFKENGRYPEEKSKIGFFFEERKEERKNKSTFGYEHDGFLDLGILVAEQFSMEYKMIPLMPFKIHTKRELWENIQRDPDELLQQMMDEQNYSVQDMREHILSAFANSEVLYHLDSLHTELIELFPGVIPIVNADEDTMESMLEENSNIGATLDSLVFFVRDVESKRVDLLQQAN